VKPARRKLLTIAAGALAVAMISGCDLDDDANLDNGRAMFVEQCGTCHVLAEAATTAEVGPDLDASFADARAMGSDSDTVEGIVRKQIQHPRETSPDDPTYMPADLVTGDDLRDVAAYVGSVAGVPGIEPPQAPGGPGGQVFANNGCGACHALAAAQSSGTVGPNLDEVLPGQNASMVETSIVDPNDEITPGFQPGVMPTNYGDTISPEDLELLVQFLVESAGNGGGNGGGGGGGNGGGGNGG
jgi:mono/diheme cytochrome c family protein